jgi:hypothetical protein
MLLIGGALKIFGGGLTSGAFVKTAGIAEGFGLSGILRILFNGVLRNKIT